MNLTQLDSSRAFANHKITEILIQVSGESECKHYCDAIVITESQEDFTVVCALPCVESLGKTFHVRRLGFPSPSPVSLSEKLNHIQVRGKNFGFVHQGKYL